MADHDAESIDDADVADRLRTVVVRLHRVLRQQADAELTPTKLVQLAAIDRHGPLSLGELATREGVAPPTVTKVVARLEEQGLVIREPDPQDRRVVLVRVTPAGHRSMERTRTRSRAWLADQLATFDAADVQRVADALPVLEGLLASVGCGMDNRSDGARRA